MHKGGTAEGINLVSTIFTPDIYFLFHYHMQDEITGVRMPAS